MVNKKNMIKFSVILLLILSTKQSFSQDREADTVKKYRNGHAPIIAARDAYKYVGQMVVLKDSLYNGRITSDSTLVCQMGEETSKHRLTMIYVFPKQFRPADIKLFNTYRKFRIVIYGIIAGNKNAPVVIVRDGNNMTFENFHFHKNN